LKPSKELDIIKATETKLDTSKLEVTGNVMEITPVMEFYACKVTMGSIDSSMGSRRGYTDMFIVEFGTVVQFEIDYGSSGLFKYIYTFTYGEDNAEIAKISYTITNNLYAMEYILNSTGDRVGIKNGLKQTIEDEYTFGGPSSQFQSPTSSQTRKSISPTFGLKQYWGSLA